MAQFLFQVAYTSDSWATQVHQHGNVLERIQPLLDGCRRFTPVAARDLGAEQALVTALLRQVRLQAGADAEV